MAPRPRRRLAPSPDQRGDRDHDRRHDRHPRRHPRPAPPPPPHPSGPRRRPHPPVTQSTVSRWLSGDLTPADDHAAQIAGLALGPDPDAPPASHAEIVASWQALIADNAGDDSPLARSMVRLARATLIALGADPA